MDGERVWPVGCVGRDLVECAPLGSPYPAKTADRGGGGLSSDSERMLKSAEEGGESRWLSGLGAGDFFALKPSLSLEEDAPGAA